MHPMARISERMLKVSGFIAREPADGAEPTQETDVYLAYDSRNFYAAFVCWDKEPQKIRARMTRREDIFSDDSAEIMIDTFDDARRGYTFAAIRSASSGTRSGPRARSAMDVPQISAASTIPSTRSGTLKDD